MRSDEQLARGVQRGRHDDLASLVERHHGPLLGFLYRMTGGDRALAEDLVQETFLRVMRGIHQYMYPRPFKPWLYAIATNVTRDLIAQARGHVWTIATSGERPDAGLSVVSTLHVADGVQYHVLGIPAPHYYAAPIEPSLEDGYIWLMSQKV